MTTDTAPTNSDVVDTVVASFHKIVNHFKTHPDELVVLVVPTVVLGFATGRHDLSWLESLVVAEAGYVLGEFALEKYVAWKKQPAGPHLKRVS